MPKRPERYRLPKLSASAFRVPKPERRRSASKRGYDHQHRKMRAVQLANNPVCATPGCGRPAVDADHIERISDGGARLDLNNLQSLCHQCHSRKTRAEGARGDQPEGEGGQISGAREM